MTVLTGVDLGTLARVGKALADPTRRRVLVQLTGGPGYPAEMAGEFGTTRANLSNHLTCLRECGLVTATAEGRRVRYELADHRLAEGLRILAALDLPGTCQWPRPVLVPGGNRMSRVQLSINVSDFDAAVVFYSRLFGTAPAKLRPGYANFAIGDPPLKLVLNSPGNGPGGTINHLGVEVGSTAEVTEAGDPAGRRGRGHRGRAGSGLLLCPAGQSVGA